MPHKMPAFERFRKWVLEEYRPQTICIPSNCDTLTQAVYALGVPKYILAEFDPLIRHDNPHYLKPAQTSYRENVRPLILCYLQETKSWHDATQLLGTFTKSGKAVTKSSSNQCSIQNKL